MFLAKLSRTRVFDTSELAHETELAEERHTLAPLRRETADDSQVKRSSTAGDAERAFAASRSVGIG